MEGGPEVGFGNDHVEVDFTDGNPLDDIRLEFNGGRDRDSLIFLDSRFQGFDQVRAAFNGGRGGSDLDLFRVIVTGGTDLTLTDDRLFTPDLPAEQTSQVDLVDVELPELIGGGGDNQFDASAVTSSGVLLCGRGGNDTLTGGWLDDRIEGGAEDDVLAGYLGNDTLVGGAGDDEMLGDPRWVSPDSRRVGDDIFVLTPGSYDQVEDPGGCDTLDFSEAELGITLDLTLNSGEIQTVDDAGNQIALTGDFESVEGTAADDDITLVAGGSTLGCRIGHDGGGGNDRITILIRELIALEEGAAIFGGPGNDFFRIAFDPQINFPPGSDPDPLPPMLIDGGSGLRDRMEFIATDRDEIARFEETSLGGQPGLGSTAMVSLFDVATQTISARIESRGVERFDMDMRGGSDQGFLQLPSGEMFEQPNPLPLSPLSVGFDGGAGTSNQFHVLGSDRAESFSLTDDRSFGQDRPGPIGVFADARDLKTQQSVALIDDPINDGFLLNEKTVLPDGDRDMLTGASGLDLFFADEEDRITDRAADRVFGQDLNWLVPAGPATSRGHAGRHPGQGRSAFKAP